MLPGPLELLILLLILVLIVSVIFRMVPKSGAPKMNSRPCPNCGTPVVPNAKFCHQCGSSLQERQGP